MQVMSVSPKPRSNSPAPEAVTTDFYFKWVPEGFKADLIDGEIIMASPASSRHEEIQSWLALVMGFYVDSKRLGIVRGSRLTFELDEFNAFEPDVSFLKIEHLSRVQDKKVIGAPDVAVEIVSKSSRSDDYGRKRDGYEQFGVPEYWIVDYMQARVEFLRLVGGRYELVTLERNSIFRSAVIDGLWLDVNDLLASPPPSGSQTALRILATP
jgi:Uma2 family endonuclease